MPKWKTNQYDIHMKERKFLSNDPVQSFNYPKPKGHIGKKKSVEDFNIDGAI